MPFRRLHLPSGEADTGRQLLSYTVVLLGLSLVFYLAGPILGSLSGFTRANVPASALMATVEPVPGARCTPAAASSRAWSRWSTPLASAGLVVAGGGVRAMPAVVVLAALLSGQGSGFAAPGWSALALAAACLPRGRRRRGDRLDRLRATPPGTRDRRAGRRVDHRGRVGPVARRPLRPGRPFGRVGARAMRVLGRLPGSCSSGSQCGNAARCGRHRSPRQLQPRLVAVPRCGRGIQPVRSLPGSPPRWQPSPTSSRALPCRAHDATRVDDAPDVVTRIDAEAPDPRGSSTGAMAVLVRCQPRRRTFSWWRTCSSRTSEAGIRTANRIVFQNATEHDQVDPARLAISDCGGRDHHEQAVDTDSRRGRPAVPT